MNDKAKPKKLHFPWSIHRCFVPIDLEFKLLFNKLDNRCLYKVRGFSGLYVNVAVVRGTDEAKPPSFQLFVQQIQHDVRQKRAK
jgi:hypothetical protein